MHTPSEEPTAWKRRFGTAQHIMTRARAKGFNKAGARCSGSVEDSWAQETLQNAQLREVGTRVQSVCPDPPEAFPAPTSGTGVLLCWPLTWARGAKPQAGGSAPAPSSGTAIPAQRPKASCAEKGLPTRILPTWRTGTRVPSDHLSLGRVETSGLPQLRATLGHGVLEE